MRRVRTLAILGLLVVLSACARLAAPPQLSPVGDVAWHANRAITGVGVLQDVVMAGEQRQEIATVDALKVITATAIAGKAGSELASALTLVADTSGVKDRAIGLMRQALMTVMEEVSPPTARLLMPYVQIVLSALTFLE